MRKAIPGATKSQFLFLVQKKTKGVKDEKRKDIYEKAALAAD